MRSGQRLEPQEEDDPYRLKPGEDEETIMTIVTKKVEVNRPPPKGGGFG